MGYVVTLRVPRQEIEMFLLLRARDKYAHRYRVKECVNVKIKKKL